MATPVLRFTVQLEDAHAVSLVFFARESDPGVVHVYAPLSGHADAIRGMMAEESKLVDHPLAQQTLDALWAEATRVWDSWFTVDTVIVVHNVVDAPERPIPEA